MNLNQEQKFAVDIQSAVISLFDKENENHKYDITTIDATAFFTGYVMAFNLLFDQLTDSDTDLMDDIATMNRLVLQYLIEHGQATKDGES